MVPPKLSAYISGEVSKGQPVKDVAKRALDAGWPREQVDEAVDNLFRIDAGENTAETDGQTAAPPLTRPQTTAQPPTGVRRFFSAAYFGGILRGTERFPYVITILTAAALFAIRPSVTFFRNVFPYVSHLEENVVAAVNETVPDDVVVTVKNGAASINKPVPYFFTVSRSTMEKAFSQGKSDFQGASKIRLLAVDTNATAEDFEKYQSMALLTQSNLIYYSDGDIKIQSLRDVKDLTIDRAYILNRINEINSNNRLSLLIQAFFYLSPVFLIIAYTLWQFLLFAVLTLFNRTAASVNDLTVTFGNSFRFTAAVSLIPMILWLITGFAFRMSVVVLMICVLSISYTVMKTPGSGMTVRQDFTTGKGHS